MSLFKITNKPINVESVIEKVVHPHAGAINIFVGTVRELTRGKTTLYLTYEAYEKMAVKKIKRIGREIKEDYPQARIAISHRIGRLDISDIAVVIAVSTPHRPEAFAASRYAIERIKEIVPIWKKEYWVGGEFWVGDQKGVISHEKGYPEV